jgi:hypothetical protein
MSGKPNSTDEIRARIEPTLDKVAVRGLRAWLRSISLSSSAYTRESITELVAKEIAEKRLAETALEKALIGFEESSDMRIYLFRMDDLPKCKVESWLPTRLLTAGFALTKTRIFAGNKIKPMSQVYAELNGGFLRVKWAEQHVSMKLNEKAAKVDKEMVDKRIVLVADFNSKNVELRINPPENRHSYEDGAGRASAGLYYQAYIDKTKEILDCTLLPVELRPVVEKLVEEENPRVVRIHIDNHTNQKNTKSKTNSSTADVRDDPDWKLGYQKNGASWAWDAQSFYWLPKVSSGFLTRELHSHINAEEGHIKVNLDCSDEEVNYVISQIRAR